MNDSALQNDGPIEARCEDLPQQANSEDAMASDGVSTQEEWRRVAQLMQAETNPEKLMELAQELIIEFDKHESPELPPAGAPSKSIASCKSQTNDQDTVKRGEQHGTTGSTQH